MALRVAALLSSLLVAASLAACNGDDDGGPAMPMEIGKKMPDGTFHPYAEGELVPVTLGPNGLNMIVPSLRAVGINPRAPDPAVEIHVGGFLMAADIEGARVDMENDGTGYVLWDLRVPFDKELCCFNCSMGTVEARIRDNSGRLFEGSIAVQLARGMCPDTTACCDDASYCPDPSLTQVCM